MENKCSKCIPVRYYIIVMVFLSSYINYATRVNFSVSLPAMVKIKKEYAIPECKREDADAYNKTISDTGAELVWNENIQGLLLGGYFYGFVIGSLPGGILAEWFGPFKTLFYGALVSCILNALSVWVVHIHWVLLFLTRLIIGVASGFGHPALQCLIGRWSPPQERNKFVSGIMGNNLGTCITWIIVGVVTKAYKWPWGFYVISLEVVIYLIIFAIFTADSPEQHKWISTEELEFIKTSQEGRVTKTKAMPPYKAILTSFPFWTLSVLHFGNLWGKYLQLTGIPKFMKEVIGFDIRSSGVLSSLPHIARLISGLFFGFVGDWLHNSKCSRNVILKSFVIISHIIPGILLASMALVKCNGAAAVTLLVLSNAINAAIVITILSVPINLSPNFAGSIYGLLSFIGGVTGFIVPSITGAIITKFGNNLYAWNIHFILGGIIFCVTGIFSMIFGTAELQPWNEKTEDSESRQN